jgi:hypothetical protein
MLENLKPPTKVKGCKVQYVADSLEPSDRTILLKAVDDLAWSGKALSSSLRELGIDISDTTLLRHRQRHCPCG